MTLNSFTRRATFISRCTLGILALGSSLCAQAVAAPPSALKAPETAVAKVPLTGLDLSTAQGLQEAQARIAKVAQQLCRKWADDRKVDHWASYSACTRETSAAALKLLTPQAFANRN